MVLKERLSHILFHEKVGFLLLCLLWYISSAVTNTTSKSIFNELRCPVTLTFLQFGFVAFFSAVCLLFRKQFLGGTGIQKPSKYVLYTTLPLSIFQIGGHVFGSLATTKIPVSTVHTVKALSPLFTVLAYRFMFRHVYSAMTYFSLVPLTFGVTLACSFELSADIVGLLYALISTCIFVSQNIFGSKIFMEAKSHSTHTKKHYNKLNLLLYSSGVAFIVMIPVWLYQEGFAYLPEVGSPVFLNLIYNGLSHFFQNILAFTLLSIISPVAYSIASLIKRIFVIVVSIIWFQQATNFTQGSGIFLTAIGLWLYDRSKKGNLYESCKVKEFEKDALELEEQTMEDEKSYPSSGTQSPFYGKNFLPQITPRLDSVVPLISDSPMTPNSVYSNEGVTSSVSGNATPASVRQSTQNDFSNSNIHDRRSSYTFQLNNFKAPQPSRLWATETVPTLKI
ncbi:putative transporter C83.11 [Schizosaccharomyces pombe]